MDTTDHANQLIEMGKEKGFLTYEEVNSILPSEIVSPEQIDNLMIMFVEMGIEIIDGVQKAIISKPKLQKTLEEVETETEEKIEQVNFKVHHGKVWVKQNAPRIFRKKYSVSLNPYATLFMTLILLLMPSKMLV